MPATKKLVLQYPPGMGMALALFPLEYRVKPLYLTATLIVFGFRCSESSLPARSRRFCSPARSAALPSTS
jgi:hypothetical protein